MAKSVHMLEKSYWAHMKFAHRIGWNDANSQRLGLDESWEEFKEDLTEALEKQRENRHQ